MDPDSRRQAFSQDDFLGPRLRAFPLTVFCRSAPQQAEEENELRKKQEQALMEKLLEQEALLEQQDPKVRGQALGASPSRAKSQSGIHTTSS